MALPYPEGKSYFVPEGLVGHVNGYHATNPKDFYTNFLVEYLWNVPAYWNVDDAKADDVFPGKHPRSKAKVAGSNGPVNWDYITFSYGTEPGKIGRSVMHNLCLSKKRLEDYIDGASAEAWYMPVPMPNKAERFVWVDLTACIRGIYVPLAQSASEHYPGISTFVHVNFAINQSVPIWRDDVKAFINHDFNILAGPKPHWRLSMGFDIAGLIQLLSIPQELRNGNVYTNKLIVLTTSEDVGSYGKHSHITDAYDIDMPAVIKANRGLNMQWVPPPEKNSPWFVKFVQTFIEQALGFVPIVGPILSIAWSLGMTGLEDPENFWEELSLYMPILKISETLKKELESSAKEGCCFLASAPQNLLSVDNAYSGLSNAAMLSKAEEELNSCPKDAYFTESCTVLAGGARKPLN
ncbi:hypothetical protein SVAN01_09416 [Stagonosporopsis vannaccii]|nr:hypothetical protein SVAN01_09416 [Stagonosporopsis vannaccii]